MTLVTILCLCLGLGAVVLVPVKLAQRRAVGAAIVASMRDSNADIDRLQKVKYFEPAAMRMGMVLEAIMMGWTEKHWPARKVVERLGALRAMLEDLNKADAEARMYGTDEAYLRTRAQSIIQKSFPILMLRAKDYQRAGNAFQASILEDGDRLQVLAAGDRGNWPAIFIQAHATQTQLIHFDQIEVGGD